MRPRNWRLAVLLLLVAGGALAVGDLSRGALARKAFALSNSADAFMSLPFGHTFKRTQARMEKSGATVKTPRGDSLTMEGYFEGRPASFAFGFYKQKLLKSKAVYIQSTGDAASDRSFYEALKAGYTRRFGSGKEAPIPNTWSPGRIMLRCAWTPDRYTTITLTYNPEMVKRFPGSSMKDRPIHLLYSYSKWD